METYKTYMWREAKHFPEFRFQTNDSKIAKRMRRSPNFEFCGIGINAPIWIYRQPFYSVREAKTSLGRLTGQLVEKDGLDSTFFSESGVGGVPKTGLETPVLFAR
tara:strand:- start:232 stop:546 length:315 start_codon:yes stop_codon:yes gene_type:complete